MKPEFIEKLRAVMVRRVVPGKPGACWIWPGAVSKNGYGCLSVQIKNERLNTAPHIAAWITARSPVPTNTCVCHSCDTPLCCNPNHLFLGSKRTNMQDCAAKGRVTGQKLSAEDAAAIFQSSDTKRSLAARYGVAMEQVTKIKRRETHRLATEGLIRGVWRRP